MRLCRGSVRVVQGLGVPKRVEDAVANRFVVGPLLVDCLACNETQRDVALASRAQWVLVRPSLLTNKPAQGDVRGDLRRSPRMRVSRADVAAFMRAQLTSDAWVNKAPFVG